MGQLPVVSVVWYMVKYPAYFCSQRFKIFHVCAIPSEGLPPSKAGAGLGKEEQEGAKGF